MLTLLYQFGDIHAQQGDSFAYHIIIGICGPNKIIDIKQFHQSFMARFRSGKIQQRLGDLFFHFSWQPFAVGHRIIGNPVSVAYNFYLFQDVWIGL